MDVYIYKSNEKWGDGYYIIPSDITEEEMKGNGLSINFKENPVGPFVLDNDTMELLDAITLWGRRKLNGKEYWDNTWTE